MTERSGFAAAKRNLVGDEPIGSGAGLCGRCIQARLVVSGRGSRFVLCQRSRTDPHFARYPALPVIRCPGFEPAAAPSTGPA